MYENTIDTQSIGSDDQFGSFCIDKLYSPIYGRSTRARILRRMFFTENDGYALRLGATQDELKEVIYLTTITAGFPRSIDAAQALREVFATSSQNLSSAQ